ncbi:MAG: hypothetical protein RLZ10_711 [Bacteroidota bacterium]
MRNLLIVLILGIIATSCEKLEMPIPKPLPISPADTLDWNLYVKFTYQNQTQAYFGMEPYQIKDVVFCEPPNYRSVEVGKEVYFKNFDNSVNMHFLYYYDNGIQRIMGNINGHSFVSNSDITDSTATINLCNSTQFLPIQFNLFYKSNGES